MSTLIIDILQYENLNLHDIVTLVNPDKFQDLLFEAGYNKSKTKYIVNGFRRGFDIKYGGPKKVKRYAPNLKLRVGSITEVWNKVMTEVKDKRFAGPFDKVPFEYFIQSPIGLVPKDKGTKTRLIFHLSYPKSGDSVNSAIPHQYCTVKYPDFDDAVLLCLETGKNCGIAKSDMARAFRNVPLARHCWPYLIMKAYHPVTKQVYYFVDKCLPFGSSISCKIFQDISDAIAFIVQRRTNKPLVNYLDDFFFVALYKAWCDRQVQDFLDICHEIQFPVSLEKTFWGTLVLVFLGLLIDTTRQVVCIPVEKINKAMDMIAFFLNKRNKKATVLQFQRLCGSLNFLCKCVIPGRVFLARLYSTISGNPNLKQHYHVKISEENRQDLQIWNKFLMHPSVFCRPFMSTIKLTSEDIDMYSDASGKIGFGVYCGTSWCFGRWDENFIKDKQPSIEYLELYALTVGVLLYLKRFPNKNVCIYCDNESVKHQVNNMSGKDKNSMNLLRLIVLECMIQNIHLEVLYVRTTDNGKADALSRLQFKRFRTLGPNMSRFPNSIPHHIWPINKIWID